MSLSFLRAYSGRRLAAYEPQPPLLDAPTDDDDPIEGVVLDGEVAPAAWSPIPVLRDGWDVRAWPERPVRFVDGKDVGQTVAWLRAPGGYPIPVRLSQIGAVVVSVEDGVCRREYWHSERVVAMTVDPFPWDEVEGFAGALQERGFRLLAARPGRLSYDFEAMRKAAQNRSNDEMAVLEEAAVARANLTPTVVDGRLEPRSGGFDQERSPVAGVVKTHSKNYLHAHGLQVLYGLNPGERTPFFILQAGRGPEVVSWYLRLAGDQGSMPNWGVVRVELPRRWLERLSDADRRAQIDNLSRTLYAYRSRSGSYARAPVSLHPIVRAEELLGATFASSGRLAHQFYRLTEL